MIGDRPHLMVDSGLHYRLKVEAARLGITMIEAANQAVQAWLKEKEKRPQPGLKGVK